MVQALEKKQTFSLDSEEFRKAVHEAAMKAVNEMIVPVLSSVKGDSDYEKIGKSFATEMARLTGASDGKVYIDPDIVSARLDARKELDQMMIEVRKRYKATGEKSDVPTYKLVNKTFLGGQMLNPSIIGPMGSYIPKTIGWLDIPNMAMVPTNPLARKIFDKFKETIGEVRDPSSTEDIWVNEQGVVKYGKNPNDYNKKPKGNANPNLVDLDEEASEASQYSAFNGTRPSSQADVGLAFVG